MTAPSAAEPGGETEAEASRGDDELRGLSDGALRGRLEALRTEELRRLGRQGDDPRRARFYRQTEKLATLGILARGLAHEFNNLFSGVIAHCDYALQSGDDEARNRALEVAVSSTRQASQIVKNIQSFARQERGRPTRASASEVVQGAVRLLAPVFKTRSVAVEEHYEELRPFVMDPVAIRQVVVNLLTNAMQASEPGGVIRIEVGREADLCCIAVRDRGHGIKEEDLDRIFAPFFSTRGVYATADAEGGRGAPGTGLGLSASYGIVRQHGGTINVETAAGEGAQFRILLPMGRGEPATAPSPERDAARESESEAP